MANYHRLTFAEREEISKGIWAGETFARIAERIDRPPSTVTREVWNNVKRKIHSYKAIKAQQKSQEKRKRGRQRKIDNTKPLKEYIHEKLKQEWSPEEIAKRIVMDYPKDIIMRVSHETIYQYLYCLPKGELKKEMMKGLRKKRRLRLPRRYAHYRKQRIEDIISISERPEEVKDRIVPGHWEGDLIMGRNRESALGSLVERTTRLILLLPLGKKDAFAVRNAFAKAFQKIPKQFTKTLTLDRGTEMAQHKIFTKDTKIQIYFADPYCPWQRGTNENTNGLVRQYFPKKTDFRKVPLSAIQEAERRLNSRPRKVLGFYTPSEKFYELITGQKIALGA